MTSAADVNGTRPRGAWRRRWQAVVDLLGGALILVVWVALWAWVAVGVAAPLGRLGAPAGPEVSARAERT